MAMGWIRHRSNKTGHEPVNQSKRASACLLREEDTTAPAQESERLLGFAPGVRNAWRCCGKWCNSRSGVTVMAVGGLVRAGSRFRRNRSPSRFGPDPISVSRCSPSS
jgi:hypothetical protein